LAPSKSLPDGTKGSSDKNFIERSLIPLQYRAFKRKGKGMPADSFKELI
jgi:hypothetical protein